jgi:hypothetical protein
MGVCPGSCNFFAVGIELPRPVPAVCPASAVGRLSGAEGEPRGPAADGAGAIASGVSGRDDGGGMTVPVERRRWTRPQGGPNGLADEGVITKTMRANKWRHSGKPAETAAGGAYLLSRCL